MAKAKRKTVPGDLDWQRLYASAPLRYVCDCATKDALLCKEHPDCRPSYCKLNEIDAAKIKVKL